MLNEYLNNPDKYIDTYRKGGKYNMLMEKQPYGSVNKIDILSWGRFRYELWSPMTWKHDFIIKDGKMITWEGHSFMWQWWNVDLAWTIYLDWNWNIIKWDRNSWYYKPSEPDNTDFWVIDRSIFWEDRSKSIRILFDNTVTK